MPELWGVCLASRKCLSCEVCAWHLTNAWAVRCVPGISRMPELWAVRRAWHLTSWLITCSAQCRSSLWPAHDQSESASCLVVRSGCRTLDQSESTSCLVVRSGCKMLGGRAWGAAVWAAGQQARYVAWCVVLRRSTYLHGPGRGGSMRRGARPWYILRCTSSMQSRLCRWERAQPGQDRLAAPGIWNGLAHGTKHLPLSSQLSRGLMAYFTLA